MNITAGNNDIYIGGICGWATGSSYPASIKDCNIYISVDVNTANSITYMGGIVGYVSGSVEIENCATYSSLTLKSKDNHPVYMGGIAGMIDGNSMSQTKIINCRAINGGLTTDADGSVAVGGIAGGVYSETCTIMRCFNDFTVDARSASYAYAGGIVGDGNKKFIIRQCYNDAPIEAFVPTPGEFSKAYAGGIAGKSDARIFACVNKAQVKGSSYAGGIAGGAENVISACSSVCTNIWGIVDETNTDCTVNECYYTSEKGATGAGGKTNNTFKYSQNTWPNGATAGWGDTTPPTGWPQDVEWPMHVWQKLGHWDASQPEYPELGNISQQ